MDNKTKCELVTRIEDILNYLLSKRYNVNVRIEFEKGKYLDGNVNKTGDFEKK